MSRGVGSGGVSKDRVRNIRCGGNRVHEECMGAGVGSGDMAMHSVTQYCHDTVNNSSRQISVHYVHYHFASFSCSISKQPKISQVW